MPTLFIKRGALSHRPFGLGVRRPSRNDHIHRFSSAENGRRLREAYADALAGRGRTMTLAELRAEVGLGKT